MPDKEYDWSRFTVRIDVNAPIEKLYHGWATREGIEFWFLRYSEYKRKDTVLKNDEFVKAGDTYTWRWYGYPDSTQEQGEILDCNGKDMFKFRFGNAGDCTVSIYKEEGATIVELTQDNIPTDEKGKQNFHIGCQTGWTFHFANMKSLYEGGVDLRNKNEKLKRMLNS